MTNKTLKKLINDEIELLKPDKSVLNKAKAIMADTQYNSIDISSDVAVVKKNKNGIMKILLISIMCIVAVTLCVSIPLLLSNDNIGDGTGSGSIVSEQIQILGQNDFAKQNNILCFKNYDGLTISNTLAEKFTNQLNYLSIKETLIFDNQEKIMTVYFNGSTPENSYEFDTLTQKTTFNDVVINYDFCDVDYDGWDASNKFSKALKIKIEINQTTYHIAVYNNEIINLQTTLEELFAQ